MVPQSKQREIINQNGGSSGSIAREIPKPHYELVSQMDFTVNFRTAVQRLQLLASRGQNRQIHCGCYSAIRHGL